MDPVELKQHTILALLLVVWCVAHSALISRPVTRYLEVRLGPVFRFYRLFFNIFSVLSFFPLYWFYRSLHSAPVFEWNGYLRIAQALLLGAGGLLFILGARHYNGGQFLGLRQIRERKSSRLLTESDDLDISGVLGVTRHPWYLGAILMMWARALDIAAIVANTVFTVYLVVGTYLEERKLVVEFGDRYRVYQNNVSMLFPVKWLRSFFAKEEIPRDR
jgi:protein-S-isoprenylcysteine O-methyltransferase Ste14